MAFIQVHADYITFLHGLAFVILASISLVQKLLGHTGISWRWLAVFGLLHGLHEWCELLLRAIPAEAYLGLVNRLLTLASFLALAEFARINWFVIRPVPRLPAWPGLALLAVGAALAVGGYADGLRIGVGAAALGACLWAAATLFRLGQQADTTGRRWLSVGAVGLALYGIGESVIKWLLTSAGFVELTALPPATTLPALHAYNTALAALITLAIWVYIQHLKPTGKPLALAADFAPKHHGRYTLWLFMSLLVVLGAGWYATDLLGRKAEEAVRGRSHGATQILASHLRDEMARTDLMANLLSKSPFALPTFAARGPESLARAATTLRQHTAVLESSVAFFMTPDGTVVASSGSTGEGGHKAENFGFLPHFQDSSAYGLAGKDLAVEPTPGQRGYYVSHPVTDAGGEVLGIAVVKKVLAQTDKEFKRYRDWFLLSPNGVIFLSSRPELLLRPMWPIPESRRQQLLQSGQLGKGPFTSPLLGEPPRDGGTIRWNDGPALANVVGVRDDGWTAVIIEELHQVATQRLYGIAATLFVALFIICFFIVVQREAAYEKQLAEDKQQLKALNEELERQATTDPLTGACNRFKFDALLAAEIDRASRYGSRFTLVMFDIDHFKRINDTWGHQTGDMVLETVARLTRDTIRRSDVFARWGGEEFMVLLPMTPVDGTLALTERLRQAFERFAFTPVPQVTCSFGITEFVPGDKPGSVVKRADDALYRAKEGGRNRVELGLAGAPA